MPANGRHWLGSTYIDFLDVTNSIAIKLKRTEFTHKRADTINCVDTIHINQYNCSISTTPQLFAISGFVDFRFGCDHKPEVLTASDHTPRRPGSLAADWCVTAGVGLATDR